MVDQSIDGVATRPIHFEKEQERDKRRERWRDMSRFCRVCFIYPVAFGTAALAVFSQFVFTDIHPGNLPRVMILHITLLSFLLFLFWIPSLLMTRGWPRAVKNWIRFLRNLLLIFITLSLFPFQVVQCMLSDFTIRKLFFVAVCVGVLLLATSIWWHVLSHHLKTPRRGLARLIPWRQGKGRAFHTLWLLFLPLGIFLLEAWSLAHLATPRPLTCHEILAAPKMTADVLSGRVRQAHVKSTGELIPPYRYLFFVGKSTESQQPPETPIEDSLEAGLTEAGPDTSASDAHCNMVPGRKTSAGKLLRALLVAWASASFLAAIVVMVCGGFTVELMPVVLPMALQQFPEREKGALAVLYHAHVYMKGLRDYLIHRHPFSVVGGLGGTVIYLGLPLILEAAHRVDLVSAAFTEDTVFFAAALLAAWIGPLSVATQSVEDTFGLNFNRTIADVIMRIQDHRVYAGYGNLGKRVVERDVQHLFWMNTRGNFQQIVTPDLTVDCLCKAMIVIDISDGDFAFAAENDLLARYGVVRVEHDAGMRLKSAPLRVPDWMNKLRGGVRSGDPWQYAPKGRFLIPALQGDMAEPFVSSRANLERARLLVSMVPDHRYVKSAIDLVVTTKTSAILCVTRSDQMFYLTYRSTAHPFTLVYPIAGQGITMGQRLWTAILKMETLCGKESVDLEHRPHVVIVGANKAGSYMLENLWINLSGSYVEKTKWIEDHVSFVLVASLDEVPGDASRLPECKELEEALEGESDVPQESVESPGRNARFVPCPGSAIKESIWPIRFTVGGRYGRPGEELVARVPVYEVLVHPLAHLDELFSKLPVDVLVMNQADPENCRLVLFHCMRALERNATSGMGQAGRFPLVLQSLVRGDISEQIALGDASGYYNRLVMLYGHALARNETYPRHSRFDRLRNRVLRESITDSMADAEEMISGIEQSLLQSITGSGVQWETEGQHIEINTCVPNLPGALANLTAQLSGLKFKNDGPLAKTPPDDDGTVFVPSFLYLRQMLLDIHSRGSVVTGYAVLKPASGSLAPLATAGEDDWPNSYARLYVNDAALKSRRSGERGGPDASQTLDSLTGRPRGEKVRADTFRRVLLDNEDGNEIGPLACPGMNICPIAAYQDYIVGSHDLDEEGMDRPLGEARHYHCRSGFTDIVEAEEEKVNQAPARFFICSRGHENQAGRLAHALNTLLFRSLAGAADGIRDTLDPRYEWVLNVQYFKDMPCHNRHFGFNRMFGYWTRRERENQAAREQAVKMLQKPSPIQIIEILPVGPPGSAMLWRKYAEQLVDLLNVMEGNSEAYCLKWYEEGGRCVKYDSAVHGTSTAESEAAEPPPVSLIIHRRVDATRPESLTPDQVGDYDLCNICGRQGKAHSCEKWRPWFNEDRISWFS